MSLNIFIIPYLGVINDGNSNLSRLSLHLTLLTLNRITNPDTLLYKCISGPTLGDFLPFYRVSYCSFPSDLPEGTSA